MYQIGQTSYSTNKSADTRFKNDQAKAAGQPVAPAARSIAGVRQQAKTPISQTQPRPSLPLSPVLKQTGQESRLLDSVAAPQDQMQQEAGPEDYESLYNDVAFESFMSAPETQQAVSRQKIRQHFRGINAEDPAEFANAVLDGMQGLG